jgi:hypothetical protein
MDNPAPTFSSQRGVPYDPQAAIKQRELREERARRNKREIDRLGLMADPESSISPRKQHAIYLDQMNRQMAAAWRERARDRRHSS